MYQLSSAVLSTIATVAKLSNPKEYPGPSASLLSGVRNLSEMFTRGATAAATAYLKDETLRASYLNYYVPVNVGKVQMLLEELRPLLPSRSDEEFRVLDVGGGPGTGSIALLDWCCSQSLPPVGTLRMTVVDHSVDAMKLSAQLWQEYARQSHIPSIQPLQTAVCDLEQSLPPVLRMVGEENGYHLIIVQNVLSELFVGSSDCITRRTALINHLMNCLAKDGSVMLIEPASRSASRALHQVRDNLLAGVQCSIYSPCLHEQPCPALLKPDDWCHEEREWHTPSWISQIDREVGFIKDALKFSYVIVRKDGKSLVPRKPDYHRVVSELREMKGEKRVWLCDQAGRSEVGRQDKERSTTNAAFDTWHRGAIVRVDEIVRKERKGRPAMVGRILSSGVAEVIRPA
ncbi:MAG: hypothetical protein LZF60_310177 [Nitrospira sp.]|nr:hypothetical protein [Nitrospira sp.]ULA61275.1 MAG: hypothetical protein LZF60_310177 [Nitrospira sp.]